MDLELNYEVVIDESRFNNTVIVEAVITTSAGRQFKAVEVFLTDNEKLNSQLIKMVKDNLSLEARLIVLEEKFRLLTTYSFRG